jgi:NAD(P)-dependent dehydrogenase (short-subunit alcohol dehydrogenase family)
MSAPRDDGPVLITGCSSGLGRASAIAFHRAGYLTVATARNPATLEPLAALGCIALPLDVTAEASRLAAVAEVERRHGTVGILVNNAGYGQYGPLEEISLEVLQRAFDTNVFGLLRMSQLVLPGMRRAGRGRIVNVSSLAGRVTAQGGGAYHMTKFAVEALADALRPEVKPFGIDVVNVLPGPFLSGYRDTAIGSIPDTGPDSAYRVYKRSIGQYMMNFIKPGGFGVMTAEHVARTVLKAATVARPRTRYNVGFWANFGPLGRAVVPDRMVDAVTSREMPHHEPLNQGRP